MKRITVEPRKNHEKIVEEQGVVYNRDVDNNGNITSYWNELAAYVLSYDEVERLEDATEEIHNMIVSEVIPFVIEEQENKNSPFQLALPDHAKDFIKNSYERGDKDIYGRFDLVYRGDEIKMLEYNADTPTGLIEASIAQWDWVQEKFPNEDQWNWIHEALIARFAKIKSSTGKTGILYFAHSEEDESGEDASTTTYMRDCASQAGWDTIGINMKEIGYDSNTDEIIGIIYDEENDTFDILENLFKLYPWEDMMYEEFGEIFSRKQPIWFEPAWKMPISNKMISAAAWHVFPDHPYLLKTYVHDPYDLNDFVKKPLYGREGDHIDIFFDKKHILKSDVYTSRWGKEGYVYQEFCPLPNYIGSKGEPNHVVLGSWVVGGESVGLGIRESNGLITDENCRFVPNVIDKTGSLSYL